MRGVTIFYVRHGETVWNRQGRFQGHEDSPLTLHGVQLAIAYGHWLRRHLFAEPLASRLPIYCSPLGRARQTAAILADLLDYPHSGTQVEPALAEADVGELAGYTWPEVETRFGIRKGQVGRWDFRPPGGESGRDQFERAAGWLAGDFAKPCIVVSHGGFSRFFRAAYLGLAPGEIDALESHVHGRLFRLEQGSVASIEIDAPSLADSPILAAG